MSDFPEKSATKMYGSTLLGLGGGGWVSNFQEKSRRPMKHLNDPFIRSLIIFVDNFILYII